MPPPDPKLKKGDEVTIYLPDEIGALVGKTVVIVELMTDKRPYWEVASVNTGAHYIIEAISVMRKT